MNELLYRELFEDIKLIVSETMLVKTIYQETDIKLVENLINRCDQKIYSELNWKNIITHGICFSLNYWTSPYPLALREQYLTLLEKGLIQWKIANGTLMEVKVIRSHLETLWYKLKLLSLVDSLRGLFVSEKLTFGQSYKL